MTEAEWQEQMRIAQDTVNALIAQRDEDLGRASNKLANLMAQINALQRLIGTKDAAIADKDKALAEKDALIKAMTTPQQMPKPNGAVLPVEAVQAPSEAAPA